MKIVEETIRDMRVPVKLLNVTRLTNFRKDGHPSIYGKNSTAGKKVSKRRQDCSHWCLPGVPDAWNELIYANLVFHQTSSARNTKWTFFFLFFVLEACIFLHSWHIATNIFVLILNRKFWNINSQYMRNIGGLFDLLSQTTALFLNNFCFIPSWFDLSKLHRGKVTASWFFLENLSQRKMRIYLCFHYFKIIYNLHPSVNNDQENSCLKNLLPKLVTLW